MRQDQVVRRVEGRTELKILCSLVPGFLVDRPTALARGPAAEEPAEWHRPVAPGVEVGEITTRGLAVSRPRRGFESRWGHQIFCRRVSDLRCFMPEGSEPVSPSPLSPQRSEERRVGKECRT